MNIKNCLFVILIIFLFSQLSLAGGKTKIIIDTDGAADDFMAISILLTNPGVEVLAIKYWLDFDRNEIFDLSII
jgi:hypothetical protein